MDILKILANADIVQKTDFRQEVCPVCQNWYHEDEIRTSVDYCDFCRGTYEGAKVADAAMYKLYKEYSAKEDLSEEDIEGLELLSELHGGYWGGEFRAILKDKTHS